MRAAETNTVPIVVTAGAFTSVHEAHLARSVLEAAGIRATLADEPLVSKSWTYSNAVACRRARRDTPRARCDSPPGGTFRVAEERGVGRSHSQPAEIIIEPAAKHTITLAQLQRRANAATKTPAERVKREYLRQLLAGH